MREKLKAIAEVRRTYREKFGRSPRLLAPRRFTEKVQWRKLFDRNPLHATLADKRAVRDYVAARAGADYLVPLQWCGLPDDIPFESITYPCVLKSTHASGQVMTLADRRDADRETIVATARDWLAVDYGANSGEPAYSDVPPRLVVETLITDASGAAPQERRLFVFDGIVACINTVFLEDGRMRNGAFHTPDWRRLDWYFSRRLDRAFPPPSRLDEMITVAERLGRGIDHVRVDVFDCGSRIYVGETTLYSWSGLSPFRSDADDLALGAHWHIAWPGLRALAATIAG